MFLLQRLESRCDALQQNREQVALAYFEMWVIEVGIGVKNDSSVDFEICFLFFYFFKFVYFLFRLIYLFFYLSMFLSPPCNF